MYQIIASHLSVAQNGGKEVQKVPCILSISYKRKQSYTGMTRNYQQQINRSYHQCNDIFLQNFGVPIITTELYLLIHEISTHIQLLCGGLADCRQHSYTPKTCKRLTNSSMPFTLCGDYYTLLPWCGTSNLYLQTSIVNSTDLS